MLLRTYSVILVRWSVVRSRPFLNVPRPRLENLSKTAESPEKSRLVDAISVSKICKIRVETAERVCYFSRSLALLLLRRANRLPEKRQVRKATTWQKQPFNTRRSTRLSTFFAATWTLIQRTAFNREQHRRERHERVHRARLRAG